MINLVLDVVGAFIIFGVGTVVGDLNKPTVDKAIAALQSYETQAEAILAKISTHKAN